MSPDAPPPPDHRDLLRSIPKLVAELQAQNAALRQVVRSARWERWALYALFLLALSGAGPRNCGPSLVDAVAGGR